MRVYKFLDKKWALVALRDRRLKIGTYDNLNDPFELLPFKTSNRRTRLALDTTVAEMAKRFGVICFSLSWSNPVIWAHYADMHRGICLGFDVPKQVVKPIRYLSKRKSMPDISRLPLKQKLQVTQRLLFTKFSHWRYEDEGRASVLLDPTTKENGLYFMDFGNKMKLAEVILGSRSPTCLRELEPVLGGLPRIPRIMRAAASPNGYKMMRDPDPVRNHDDLRYFIKRGKIYHPVQFVRD